MYSAASISTVEPSSISTVTWPESSGPIAPSSAAAASAPSTPGGRSAAGPSAATNSSKLRRVAGRGVSECAQGVASRIARRIARANCALRIARRELRAAHETRPSLLASKNVMNDLTSKSGGALPP